MDEFLDIVDEEDNVTGREKRPMVHQLGLWHRGVHVFLFREDGQLLIQKRSADRSSYPSLIDCSVSEHVQAGESYLDAALRGTKEELGIEGIQLQPLLKFKMNYGPNDNEISTLYRGALRNMPVHFDPVEIESVTYESIENLKLSMQSNSENFCGWFVEILNWHINKSARLTVLKTY